MKFGVAILLMSFTGIAVFGILSMNHNSMQSHEGGCIAALAGNIDCITQANVLEYLTAHFSLFENFTSVMPDGNIGATLLLSFSALFFAGVVFIRAGTFTPEFARVLTRARASRFSLPTRKFTHFLSLLETSPTAV